MQPAQTEPVDLKELERKIIREVSDKIYAMRWAGVDSQRDYWRNHIAWLVLCMAKDVEPPQAEIQKD